MFRGAEAERGFVNVGASCQPAPVTTDLFALNLLSFEAMGEE